MNCPTVLAGILGLISANLAHAGEETIRLRDGPGRDVTSAVCALCHSLDYIEMNAAVQNPAGWEKSVRKMIDRFGAPASADQARQIIEYLAQNYSNL